MAAWPERRSARKWVARRRQALCWMSDYKHMVDQLFEDLRGRCRVLCLCVVGSEARIKRDFAMLLAVRSAHYLHRRVDWHVV